MKFGKKLESQQDIPVFRQQFVSYTNLKKLIKEINISERRSMSSAELLGSDLWWFDSTQKTSINSIPADRVDFIRAVEDEIDKTQHVYTSMSTSIKHMLRDIYARLNSRFRLEKIEDDIDSISSDVLVLDRYIWHAKQLVLKITKKHDRATKFQVQSWMLVRLERSEWWNAKLDEYLIGVSDAYTAARLLAQNADGMFVESRKVGEGESFVRKNEKYFVKPEDVMLVKLLIARHVPLDIFGRKKKKADAPLKLDDLAGLTDASVCNSIYLDDDARTMYHERTGLEGVKGNIIRIRWYGSFANPCDECWMERKTRRIVNPDEDYCMDEAVKERFRINKRNIASYMSGKWAMAKKAQSMVAKKQIKEAQVGPMLETANNIQEEIVTKHLHSALRTVVRRSAFQAGSDQSLRFSLDHNLHIIDEVNSGDGWARNLEEPLKLSSVKTLPYAVLEIKTQKDAPAWVNELKESGYIIPSAHFSKFLYGTCKLAPSEVRFYPMWWERVVELEVQIPGSPPLIMCPLMTRTPSSVKFRSSLVDKMEQQSDAYEAKMIAQLNENTQKNATLTKKESRKATEYNKYNNPVAGIEMSQINQPSKVAFKEQPTLKAASPTSDDGATLITVKKPTQHQTNGGGLFNLGKKSGDKKMTAKQKTMEQRAAKTFFANERTMLSWLNASTFLALAGITLLSNNTETGRDAGVALIAVTVIFALYALYKYLTRLTGLQESKKAGLADKWGPPVLIACFAAVLIFLAIYYGRKATENLDGSSSS